jgi:hypothetical protein
MRLLVCKLEVSGSTHLILVIRSPLVLSKIEIASRQFQLRRSIRKFFVMFALILLSSASLTWADVASTTGEGAISLTKKVNQQEHNVIAPKDLHTVKKHKQTMGKCPM